MGMHTVLAWALFSLGMAVAYVACVLLGAWVAWWDVPRGTMLAAWAVILTGLAVVGVVLRWLARGKAW